VRKILGGYLSFKAGQFYMPPMRLCLAGKGWGNKNLKGGEMSWGVIIQTLKKKAGTVFFVFEGEKGFAADGREIAGMCDETKVLLEQGEQKVIINLDKVTRIEYFEKKEVK